MNLFQVWRTLFVCGVLAVAPYAMAASLYQESTYHPLTGDRKAFRVGDLLTVQVFENSSATTTADTGTRRTIGQTAELSHAGVTAGQTGLNVGSNFDGGGATQRTSKILAILSVTVKEVLPNGELKVGGEQLLTVNDEPQTVTLEGRVRPADISNDNVVLSTRLADAKIAYVGDGSVAERTRKPKWRSFLDWLGF
jgi:flagellar L-ring protein precursor FlgH